MEMLKINGNYLILDTNVTTNNKKKMTGHSFVALANLDQYNKRGDAVLQLLGYYKSNVDPKWLKRGNMGEKMIEFILKKKNEEYKSYSEEDKRKNKWDFFPEYRQCGGIPDFEIPKKSTMIEVKSKSLNKYDEKEFVNVSVKKIYYINFVLRISWDEGVFCQRYRVVMNRDGIVSMESLM